MDSVRFFLGETVAFISMVKHRISVRLQEALGTSARRFHEPSMRLLGSRRNVTHFEMIFVESSKANLHGTQENRLSREDRFA